MLPLVLLCCDGFAPPPPSGWCCFPPPIRLMGGGASPSPLWVCCFSILFLWCCLPLPSSAFLCLFGVVLPFPFLKCTPRLELRPSPLPHDAVTGKRKMGADCPLIRLIRLMVSVVVLLQRLWTRVHPGRVARELMDRMVRVSTSTQAQRLCVEG